MSRRIPTVALVIGLLLLQLPALGAEVSAGGPWSYIRNQVACEFTGLHDKVNGSPRGITTDFNNQCFRLRVRVKYIFGTATITTDWIQNTGQAQVLWVFQGTGTTVASEHQAQHPLDDSWSTVRRPHAF
jgi:hypothetical protein